MMITQLAPYLTFSGNAIDAIRFYEEVFAAKTSIHYYSGSPEEFDGKVPEEIQDLVMHSDITTENFTFHISDNFDTTQSQVVGNTFSLMLYVEASEEALSLIDKLGAGGEVIMPYEVTSYSGGFSMFTDKFGVQWQVIVNP